MEDSTVQSPRHSCQHKDGTWRIEAILEQQQQQQQQGMQMV